MGFRVRHWVFRLFVGGGGHEGCEGGCLGSTEAFGYSGVCVCARVFCLLQAGSKALGSLNSLFSDSSMKSCNAVADEAGLLHACRPS